MSIEIITLIIGTILGALLAFSFNILEKHISFKKEKRIAIMCLRIELKRVEKFTTSLTNTKLKFGHCISDQNIPDLNLTTQSHQFMYYNEDLASKIYELAKHIEGANHRRQIAFPLIGNSNSPTFMTNVEIYEYEVENTIKLTKEIGKIIGLD